jgi:hypothetical protein
MGGGDLRIANADEAYDKMDPLVNKLVDTIASSGSQPRQQGGNIGASAYYGTWLLRNSGVLIIDSNKVTFRYSDGTAHFVLSNCTWTTENNSDAKTLIDYPKGFKIYGTITEISGGDWPKFSQMFTPIYIFIHRSDSNRIILYDSPSSTSEIQSNSVWNGGPFSKIQ